MGIVWLSLAVVLGVLESVTFQFISIWFAGGAIAALIAELLGAGITVQWITFVLSSAILLALTRPLVKKLSRGEKLKTNADGLIGKNAVMTASTDSLGEAGEARLSGSYWTAKSIDGEPIEKDTLVTVEKIEGVKLIVKK